MKKFASPYHIVTGLLVVAYISIHGFYFAPAISSPDAHSYYKQTALLVESCQIEIPPQSDVQYIGPHWYKTSKDTYACTHPPGLSIVFGLFYLIGGVTGALLANLVLAATSLCLVFLIAKHWMNELYAFVAVLLMALNPTLNHHIHFGDSHIAVGFFLLAGVYALLLARSNVSSKHYHYGLLLASGFCIGIIPSIRYPETLFILLLGLWIGISIIRKTKLKSTAFKHTRIRMLIYELVFFGMGAAIPFLALLIRNQITYGAFWMTGYAVINEQSAFGLAFFLNNFDEFIIHTALSGNGVILALGLIGVLVLLRKPETRNQGLLLSMLTIPSILLYMAWYRPPDPMVSRFILPTLFFYVIAGLSGLFFHTTMLSKLKKGLLIGIIIGSGAWGAVQSHLLIQHETELNTSLFSIYNQIQNDVPDSAVLITNQGIGQYLDILNKWKVADSSILQRAACFNPTIQSQTPFQDTKHIGPMKQDLRLKPYVSLQPNDQVALFLRSVSSWSSLHTAFWLMDSTNWYQVYSKMPALRNATVIKHIKIPNLYQPLSFLDPSDQTSQDTEETSQENKDQENKDIEKKNLEEIHSVQHKLSEQHSIRTQPKPHPYPPQFAYNQILDFFVDGTPLVLISIPVR